MTYTTYRSLRAAIPRGIEIHRLGALSGVRRFASGSELPSEAVSVLQLSDAMCQRESPIALRHGGAGKRQFLLQHLWVGCHQRAFESFGGVPRELVIDDLI